MKSMRITAIFLRYLIGLVLVATGIGKLLDLVGFANVISTYQVFSPSFPLYFIGLLISVGEVILGVWLFSGKYLKWAALLALLMHLSYAAWSAFALFRGLKLANCGCFGVFLARPLSISTVYEDLFMSLLCLLLFLLGIRFERKPLTQTPKCKTMIGKP